MKNILLFAATAACFLATFLVQEPAPAKHSTEGKYSLEAVLVLTPGQCSEESKKGNWVSGKEKYRMGELLCPAAESAVQQAFEKYTRVEALPAKGTTPGKVILTPKFTDLEATKTVKASSKRKMVLLVEWTAMDESGKVFWVQTVEGSAEEKSGNAFTAGSHRRKMIESVKQDLTDKSVQAMRQSPEFQKLVQKAR